MAETDLSRFRLGAYTLEHLDALAASAGSRSQAVREAAAYWRRAVEEAGRANAAELAPDDWIRLAHLNDPDPLPSDVRDDAGRSAAWDWSQRLAQELVGMWEGRDLTLPMHREEARACRELARRVAGWGVVRGYALFACLRHFWRAPNAAEEWWRVEAWMTPAARDQ